MVETKGDDECERERAAGGGGLSQILQNHVSTNIRSTLELQATNYRDLKL